MKESNLSIHTFVDASKTAYAACICLRNEFKVNEIRWKFNPPSMVGRRVLRKLLGRVLEKYPGKGGIIRLVKLRTEKGNIKTNPTTVPFGIDTKLRASRTGNSEGSESGN
ncbi:hypothetical protein CDAR_88401 [Caerostris darwini]|uniref:Uncharacterized protein n=1 Tax=Caerostris darwini TaxID=1538125 RepID=A0AAV4Q3P6_9ARAC|nr:hypothetical protein CDAR_88401 [Caerostris darwini]